MGTPLTGQTKASTYDSLLKITDNGPVGGTEKVVTDGLGNDSALKVGTAGISSTGTIAAAGEVSASGSAIYSGASVALLGGAGSSNALYTTSTGSPVQLFDHRGSGNTGSWQFRNGTNGASTAMVVSASGNVTATGTLTSSSGTLGSMGCRAVTISASAPSGGADGDVWLQYV